MYLPNVDEIDDEVDGLVVDEYEVNDELLDVLDVSDILLVRLDEVDERLELAPDDEVEVDEILGKLEQTDALDEIVLVEIELVLIVFILDEVDDDIDT